MTRDMKAIIVDDEPLARTVVREFLSTHPEVAVVAECSNGFEAVKTIGELHPDLLFLDIQMPKLNGFEVLELIEEHPAVVFITAYDEHALKAFEVHAVDYLLKPFSQERFDDALARVSERTGASQKPALTALSADIRFHDRPLQRIPVKDGTKVHIIPVEKIDYFEAQDDYVCIRADGRKHLKQTTLSELEADLDPKLFVRTHRSFILNIERISRIELYAKDSRVVVLTDGTRLHVSRTGYGKLKGLLNE